MAIQGPSRKDVKVFYMNTVPKPVYEVEFKPLPFYRNVHKIVLPMAIYCIPKVEPEGGQSQVYTPFDFEFELPEIIRSIINSNIKDLRLQIRFGEEKPGKKYLSDGLPGPVQLRINTLTPISAQKSPINYDCKSLDDRNKIVILWPSCETPYYMIVDIVEIITIEDLVKRIQFNNKLCSVKLNTKAKAIELLKNSDSEILDSGSYKFILFCPITKLRMKLPTKSLKCSHLQCFDLHSFIAMNKIKQTWTCPICMIPILVDELVIDSFLLDIINNSTLPEKCFEIALYANGEWEPCIEPKKENESNGSESDDEYLKNTIIPMNSDNFDDKNIRDEKPILPITNSWNSNEPMSINQTTTINETNIKEEPVIKKE
ncbi:E3 SUMO-protein ligase SIZ1-like [Melanaphis sacchari]|uniref:E3 SUMO-protein ligase SIZ1-like n=1 Tax=Melanaphis sacchari TaxID=742174 RepID=UPI000DC1506F|nr:E3 SUMO-protein ligase SIZ1-like [Melanaphis sacchari]